MCQTREREQADEEGAGSEASASGGVAPRIGPRRERPRHAFRRLFFHVVFTVVLL